MRKTWWLWALAGFILILGTGFSAGSNTPCNPQIEVKDNKSLVNGLRNYKNGILGAKIFDFTVEYIACPDSPPRVELNDFKLTITQMNKITEADFARIYVKEIGSDKIFAARLEKKDAIWWLSINFDLKFETGNPNRFIVFADLPKLSEGANFTITFNASLMSALKAAGGKPITFYDRTGTLNHYAGNRAPNLSFANVTTKESVTPKKGFSGDSFEFKIQYRDSDNEAPKVHQVWIDLNGDGKYQKNEKFDMELVGKKENVRFDNYQTYRKELTIVVENPRVIKYKFHFENPEGAESHATSYTFDKGSSPLDEFSFEVQSALFFGPVKLENSNFVRGEIVKAVIPVFYLFEGLEIDWASIAKNDFKPFRLLHWQKGRGGLVGEEYSGLVPSSDFDFQEIILFLASDEAKAIHFKLKPLKLTYRAKSAASAFSAKGPSYEFERTLFRPSFNIDKQLIRIGDRFQFKVSVTREKSVKVLDFDPKRLTFEPFELVDFSSQSRVFEFYAVDAYIWTLTSFYFIAKPIPMPGLTMNWRDLNSKSSKDQSQKLKPWPIIIVPTIGPADNILSMWDAGELPMPKITFYSRALLPIGLGASILGFSILFFIIKRILVWFSIVKAKPEYVFRRLRRKIFRSSRQWFVKHMGYIAPSEFINDFKSLVGLVCGLAPEEALASTSQTLSEKLKSKSPKLWEELALDSERTVFEAWEQMIFGRSYDRDIMTSHLNLMRNFIKNHKFLPRF